MTRRVRRLLTASVLTALAAVLAPFAGAQEAWFDRTRAWRVDTSPPASFYRPVLEATSDGGRSWRVVTPFGNPLYGLFPTGPRSGIVRVGNDHYWTRDAGVTWIPAPELAGTRSSTGITGHGPYLYILGGGLRGEVSRATSWPPAAGPLTGYLLGRSGRTLINAPGGALLVDDGAVVRFVGDEPVDLGLPTNPAGGRWCDIATVVVEWPTILVGGLAVTGGTYCDVPVWVVSRDGGSTWQRTARAGGGDRESWSDLEHAFRVSPTDARVIQSTQDGGASWRQVARVRAAVSHLVRTSARHGVARSGDRWIATADGGATWHPLKALAAAGPAAGPTGNGTALWWVEHRGRSLVRGRLTARAAQRLDARDLGPGTAVLDLETIPRGVAALVRLPNGNVKVLLVQDDRVRSLPLRLSSRFTGLDRSASACRAGELIAQWPVVVVLAGVGVGDRCGRAAIWYSAYGAAFTVPEIGLLLP